MSHTNMKYIGVLRDTARAPKPTTQYNTIQYHVIPFKGNKYTKRYNEMQGNTIQFQDSIRYISDLNRAQSRAG